MLPQHLPRGEAELTEPLGAGRRDVADAAFDRIRRVEHPGVAEVVHHVHAEMPQVVGVGEASRPADAREPPHPAAELREVVLLQAPGASAGTFGDSRICAGYSAHASTSR